MAALPRRSREPTGVMATTTATSQGEFPRPHERRRVRRQGWRPGNGRDWACFAVAGRVHADGRFWRYSPARIASRLAHVAPRLASVAFSGRGWGTKVADWPSRGGLHVCEFGAAEPQTPWFPTHTSQRRGRKCHRAIAVSVFRPVPMRCASSRVRVESFRGVSTS